MNGTAKVDPQKESRVWQVIEETGFKPNEAARTLFKKSANAIGVIVPNIQNPFFNEMARAIEEETYRRGYRMMLCNSNNDLEKERNNIDLLNRMHADGIILLTSREGIERSVEESRIPVVILDREIGMASQIACVRSDHYKGGCLAMEHLIRCGCRRIVAMRGTQTLSSARGRFEGYLDTCRKYEMAPRYVDCQYSFKEGLKSTEELLRLYPDADGILACNDMVAISVYKVLQKHGRRVPQDVQLIGYDGINLGELMTPELTTIVQPIFQMGEAAARALTDHIEGKELPENIRFDVELIQRETTMMR